MPRPILSVIGSLSIDTSAIVGEFPEPGQMVTAEKHYEVGGRAATIAIAANRSCHARPNTDNGLLSDTEDNESSYNRRDDYAKDESIPEVRIVAAVIPEKHAEYVSMLRQNGVKTEGLKVFDAEGQTQAEVFSMVQRDTGRARQVYFPGVEQLWTEDHFDTPEKLGGGVRPDLVVVSTELNKLVVEKIINTAHADGIDVIVYASPAVHLLGKVFPRITHLITDEGDATTLLGHPRTYCTIDKATEVCEDMKQQFRAQNVILKGGLYGAYYRSDYEEGYASGYLKRYQIQDATGSTGAFVGVYAAEYVKAKRAGTWQLSEAVIMGNKVCAFCVVDRGCIYSTPWAKELGEFDDSPWFENFDELKSHLNPSG